MQPNAFDGIWNVPSDAFAHGAATGSPHEQAEFEALADLELKRFEQSRLYRLFPETGPLRRALYHHLASFKALLRDYYAFTPPDEVLDSIDGTPLGEWIAAFGSQSAERGETFENFGEDNFFVRRARKAGYAVWCDLDATFTMIHLGIQEVTCKLPEQLQQAAE
jgi:hypothetical protein